jgi:hypothetical protein
MQLSDWRIINTISITLGIIFLIGGGSLYYYAEGYGGFSGMLQAYEYRAYIAPLIIAGITLLVLAYASNQKITELKTIKDKQIPLKETTSDQEVKYCMDCGTKTPQSAKFCPKCGKNLQ